MRANHPPPEWSIEQWINTDRSLEPDGFEGRVVMIHAFQMLCPGCVQHAVPQAERVHRSQAGDELIVIGLHTVFEHHQAMGPDALAAFVHEYRITHPIGIDQPAPDQRLPLTMQRWELNGTPSLILLDRSGRVRLNRFGRVDDLELGLMLGKLLAESAPQPSVSSPDAPASDAGCGSEGCSAPAA
ncbi:MAG: TlpA family protein disulfide reductase [Wenzhouxiangellaceae bacterium]